MKTWNTAETGKVHEQVIKHVQRVEQEQFDLFDLFVKLACLYDPNSDRSTSGSTLGVVTENVVASNVDTVCAAISATDVRARFMTDDGDWATQRMARHLEWYANGLSTEYDVHDKCRHAFKSAAIKGTGIVWVMPDKWGRIQVEAVEVDDIVVDETEVIGGMPRQMHRRTNNVSVDVLVAAYPDHKAAIEKAAQGSAKGKRMWADYRPIQADRVVTVESIILPIGKKGEKGYKAGRYVKTIDGADLEDRKWEKPFFPVAKMVWSEKLEGWYGISAAERIAGHQRIINKGNWQIDRLIDQYAVPTTYVRMGDANLAVKQSNRLGTIAVYKQDIPKTIHPPAVSGEVYNRTTTVKNSAFEEFGVSRLAAQSAKPAGLDSGVALREYRDQTTQRFSMQEKAFEALVLDAIWLIVDACKDLGAKAPTIMRRTRFGAKRIKWADVDMRDVKVQIQAASTLPRTPAGRMQTVIEWAQAGIVSQDEARRLMQHPDLERAMSLYTAAIENIEHCLDEIADGAVLMPEPFQNLKLCVWRGQQEYLLWRDLGAPEERLESLRQFVVQAAYIVGQQQAGPVNDGVVPQQAPQAALAEQAMQLQAG